GVSADVSDFKHPVLSKSMLYGQVPLLGVGNHKVARNRQTKNELRREYARTAARTTVVGECCSVTARETLESSEARNEIGIQNSWGGEGVGIAGKLGGNALWGCIG